MVAERCRRAINRRSYDEAKELEEQRDSQGLEKQVNKTGPKRHGKKPQLRC